MNLEKEVGHLAKLLFWILPFLVAVSVYFLYASSLGAGSNVALSGFAWSGNTGWISFNCANTGNCPTSNYVVSMDQDTGFLSGYALSDNIGWVQAYTSPTGCPVSPCEARVNRTTGRVTGWFKALAGGAAQSGGWDGWIQLSDSSGGVSVNDAGTAFQGYAWGADVMGWIDMSGVLLGDSTPTLVNGKCGSADGGTFGATPNIGLCETGIETAVSGTGPWAWACSGINGGISKTCSANKSGGTDVCPDDAGVQTSLPCPGSGTDLCLNLDGLQTSVPAGRIRTGAGECVGVDTPAIEEKVWKIFPLLVRKGERTNIYWDVSHATSCTVSGTNGDEWSGNSSGDAGSIGKTSSEITARTTYTLKCKDLSNVETTYRPISVNVIPSFQEK